MGLWFFVDIGRIMKCGDRFYFAFYLKYLIWSTMFARNQVQRNHNVKVSVSGKYYESEDTI